MHFSEVRRCKKLRLGYYDTHSKVKMFIEDKSQGVT